MARKLPNIDTAATPMIRSLGVLDGLGLCMWVAPAKDLAQVELALHPTAGTDPKPRHD